MTLNANSRKKGNEKKFRPDRKIPLHTETNKLSTASQNLVREDGENVKHLSMALPGVQTLPYPKWLLTQGRNPREILRTSLGRLPERSECFILERVGQAKLFEPLVTTLEYRYQWTKR